MQPLHTSSQPSTATGPVTRPILMIVAMVVALLITGAGAAVPAAHADDGAAATNVVHIPDPSLKAAINAVLGGERSPSQEVIAAEAATITRISASGGSVSDLTGLEALINLTDLQLPAGTISDLSPLTDLKLSRLVLPGNLIEDLSPLAGSTGMRNMLLSNNRISDLSPLADMRQMSNLQLDDNQISDLSPLSAMSAITVLYVRRNQIADVTPLVPLATLNNVILSGNQIVDVSPLAAFATRPLGNSFTFSIDSNQIADLTPFGAFPRNPSSGNQAIYVGPYQDGGVTVTLKNRDGSTPTLSSSGQLSATYDAASGLLTLNDPTTESVGFSGGFRVYFRDAPADPSADGTAVVEQVLSAQPGTWSTSTDAPAYQWLREGRSIGGAVGAQYLITAADLGHRLRVRVTIGSQLRTSLPSAVVTSSETERPVVSASLLTQSGVVGDPTNPGIDLTIGQLDVDGKLVDPDQLTVNATVSGLAGTALTADQIGIAATGDRRSVTFAPTAAGTTAVTFTVTGTSGKTASTTVNYYVSKATSATSRVVQHISDPSTAIVVGDGHLLIADDEKPGIGLYRTDASGPPVATFVAGESDGEIDYESSARNGKLAYWLGSHGNSKRGAIEENRHIIFATEISGAGASAKITPIGTPYRNLRRDLVDWDASNGNRLGFVSGAVGGVLPDDRRGFNIEGAEFSPDDGQLYLSFRSPVVPATTDGKAVIVPLKNVNEVTTGAADRAEFGEPILLDLGGMSIREIRKNANDEYLILGATSGTPTAATSQALFAWSGDAADSPLKLTTELPVDEERFSDSRPAWEGIGALPDRLAEGQQIRLIMDQGYAELYVGSGTDNKDDGDLQKRKARTDLMTLAGRVGLTVEVSDAPVFPAQRAGTIGPAQVVTITNTGAQRLRLGALRVVDTDGASADDFIFTGNTCAGAALGPDQTCELRIRFAPARVNTVSLATMVLESNLPDGPIEVVLTGKSTRQPAGGSTGGGKGPKPNQ